MFWGRLYWRQDSVTQKVENGRKIPFALFSSPKCGFCCSDSHGGPNSQPRRVALCWTGFQSNGLGNGKSASRKFVTPSDKIDALIIFMQVTHDNVLLRTPVLPWWSKKRFSRRYWVKNGGASSVTSSYFLLVCRNAWRWRSVSHISDKQRHGARITVVCSLVTVTWKLELALKYREATCHPV
jgi:hypothetical protein